MTIKYNYNGCNYDTLEEAQQAETNERERLEKELSDALDVESRNSWFYHNVFQYRLMNKFDTDIIIIKNPYGELSVLYYKDMNEFIKQLAVIFDNKLAYNYYDYTDQRILQSIINSPDATFSKAAFVWENNLTKGYGEFFITNKLIMVDTNEKLS